MTTQTFAKEYKETIESVKAGQELFLTADLLCDMFGEYIGVVAPDKKFSECSEQEIKQIKKLYFSFITERGIVITDEIINKVSDLMPSSPLSSILANEFSKESASNPWVWTTLTESLQPKRKAGESVPTGYMTKGHTEYFPYAAWIRKGYVERNDKQKLQERKRNI